ncbi:MAG TPA: glycosyltransferase family 39 protein [Stellaceae bacterium]|nr:glycosyltransferase family 39 protein [Stellaceae bacterium]
MQLTPRRIAVRSLIAWGPPLLVGIVALALRLHGLAAKPLWLDEVSTLHRATIGFSAMVTQSLHSKHYPSYFALIWLVAKLGGVSPWVLRLPSAVFGAIAAALVVVIGRDADRPRTGIAAGLLLAFSPFDIQYGQEARSYTLVAALILVALWGLVRLARQTTTRQATAREKQHQREQGGGRGAWLAYGGGTLAALCVLNVAIPWLVASNVAAGVIAWRARARRVFLRRWAVTQAVILALWLPALAAVAYFSNGAALEGPGWALSEKWSALWAIIGPVYLDRISAFITFDMLPASVPGLSLLIAALAAYGAWRLRQKPSALIVIGCAACVLPLLLLLVSRITPVLVPRYFAWSAAPFFILAGAGIARLRSWRYAGALAAFVLVGLVNLEPYYHAETKPRWDLADARLSSETQPGDVVLFNSWDAYYVASSLGKQSGLDPQTLAMTWKPEDAARFEPGHALWVVFGRAGQGKMERPADYVTLLSQLGRPASEEQIGRYITIWRFAAPDAVANAAPASGATAN